MKTKKNGFITTFVRYHLARKLGINMISIRFAEPGQPWDFETGQTTYIMRACNPLSKVNRPLYWDFDMRDNVWVDKIKRKAFRKRTHCDYYLLVGLENESPTKVFLIDAKKTPGSHVRISVKGESKYQQYEI